MLAAFLIAIAGPGSSSPLAPRQSFAGDTENGLTGLGTVLNPCVDNIVIFARGTTEPGNVGTLVGPPFFEAFANIVGNSNLVVQGVDYPANIAGFLEGGDPAGSKTMASDIEQALSDCPGAKVIISGYSQGGQLVHNAANLLSSDITAQIAGAIIFGDPDNGTAVTGISAADTDVYCHVGDDICLGGDLVLPQHLTYADDADAAAQFAAALP
ncbi:family 5 carbohydrate esterase [Cryphonectria parasitica EP155]|uniref:Cutinase n=1 Tax=Cryphonectria parasitica (strain ATCC 38755 / EP155) TaxID=660469 RepID=A0A9P4Y4Q3_CRYP1|nr:family 5 carbohydrate esterase [Cryphonectria parasitica EP155]KAF3766621.1 family 5 carbohydrate esterase [Cryphonectria parasitica EP155]